ncbi:MAG: histidine--tRNA ligase [Candidatus Falkowbacteria bacterium]
MSRPKKDVKPIREAVLQSKVRGLKDTLPEEYKYWDLVTKKAVELARVYSFRRLDLPLVEYQALFEKAAGKGSELVSEELALLTTKTGEKIAIRSDALPGLVRSYLEHGLLGLVPLSKTFWLGPVLVFESSQAGRPRQFNQASYDIIGDFGPAADAQLIMLAYNFCKELQLEAEVQINSVGCSECRPAYLKALNESFKERGKKTKLCNECKKQLLKNPLKIFDCREEDCIDVTSDLPPIVDHLCDTCQKQFERVLEYLDNLSIPYNLNTRLFAIRGYDFWQRTVFEVMPAGETRRHLALAAGGNYAALVDSLGSKVPAASGVAIDIERVISRIRSSNLPVEAPEKVDIFLAQVSEQAKQKCMILFEELRKAGFKCREHLTSDALKVQLEEAERVKTRFTLILGQKELMDNTILLRDMESGVQETIDMRKLATELDKRLNIS